MKCSFFSEASLSGVEPLMQKVHNEIRVVDAEILTAVRQQAVSQLCSHFDSYRDNPKITELRDKFKNIKQILNLGTGKESEDSNLLQQLSDACLVIDALEPSVKEELLEDILENLKEKPDVATLLTVRSKLALLKGYNHFFNGLKTKFDIEMAAMTRVAWGTLESVGDQSEYFFSDKLASSLGPLFYLNIFKCKQISETGAQQMLLDTQAVKTILLDIPSLGKQTSGAASYLKFVSREMTKAEALLKVILSPVDSVVDTYSALLPEGTPSEVQHILELKVLMILVHFLFNVFFVVLLVFFILPLVLSDIFVIIMIIQGLKNADQQTILEDVNKHRSRISQLPIATSAVQVILAATPAPSPVVTQPSSALIASREDVLTRAAALGRGAATTRFKRFLALTEAAKDRTDGPFRKLFNA
nr:vacuolar protein sorting-associated protein 53 A [Tanacetum cinerariifolium]